MARESFSNERSKLQVIGTDDLPDLVSVDLDDKDPNRIEVVEVDDRSDTERATGERDELGQWTRHNAKDPRGVTPRVQKRFDRLKAETETERSLRIQTERERDEAVGAAQRQQAEINDLRQRLSNSTGTLAESMAGERKARMSDAQRRLEQAHAEGNSVEIAKATADMTTAAAELTQITANTPRRPDPAEQQRQVQQPERQVQQRQTEAPQLAANVVGWIAANPWFNKDVSKTKVAVSIHNALEARGIAPESDAYTRELDKGMKAMYPDHQPYSGSLEDGDDADRPTAPRRTNAVAAGSRETRTQTNSRTVELTSTQLAIAKRLGVTPQAYAAELVKYNANRKDA